MSSSTLLVANSAELSSLSWFPQCLQWTHGGWAAGEGPEGGGEGGGSVSSRTRDSLHLREEKGAQTQAHITGEHHLPPPDSTPHSTFTQHTTPTHLPGHLLQGLTQSCPSVHPQCALSQSGPRHPTGSSRSHCYHAPTSSSGSPDKDHLHL